MKFASSVALLGIVACSGPLLGTSTTYQSPAVDGVFSPCQTVRDKSTVVDDVEILLFSVVLFLPRAVGGPDCNSIASPNRPLALIYHASGEVPGDYRELGLRLSSHGFVVASLQNATELTDAIEFIDSEIGGFLSDDVVLIGHSSGGNNMVQRRGQPVALGRNVRALVLMAPSVSSALFPNYTLSGVDAFLGLHWVGDNDQATWGAPVLPSGGLRRSVFRIYDRAGVDFSNPELLALSKHFVFFDYGDHFQQDQPGVLAIRRPFCGATSIAIWDRISTSNACRPQRS